MATAFDVALKNFENYAWATDRDFGRGISSIIQSEYVNQMPYALGAITATGSADDFSPVTGTVDKITQYVTKVSGNLLKSLDAYYATLGHIADLKVQAQGNPITRANNATPKAFLLWAAVGVGAILLLTRRK